MSDNRYCEACGDPKVSGILGATFLCAPCRTDIEEEVKRLRAAGDPVNVMHIARRMFRAQHSAGDYILRDIPRDLWARVQERAAVERLSLREMIISALHAHIK